MQVAGSLGNPGRAPSWPDPRRRAKSRATWAGHTHTNPLYIIYYKPGAPYPVQNSAHRTRRNRSFCVRGALDECPLRGQIRTGTDRCVGSDGPDTSRWAPPPWGPAKSTTERVGREGQNSEFNEQNSDYREAIRAALISLQCFAQSKVGAQIGLDLFF